MSPETSRLRSTEKENVLATKEKVLTLVSGLLYRGASWS